jgi:hypothetical protein
MPATAGGRSLAKRLALDDDMVTVTHRMGGTMEDRREKAQDGDFARGEETLPRDEHAGSFAEGEETLPEDEHVGSFAEGDETLPEDDRIGSFADTDDDDTD